MPRVPVPPTSHYTVVFPLKTWSRVYDASSYNPAQAEGRATLEEVNQVLQEMYKIQKPFRTKVNLASFLYIIFLLASMILSGIAIANSYDDVEACFAFGDNYCYWTKKTNSGQLALSIIGGIFGIFVSSCIYIAIVVKVTRSSRVPARALFDRVNPNFATRGLRWQLPVHFPRWIELSKDYVNQTQPAGQPVYLPPPMTQQYQNYPDIPGGMNQPAYNQQNQPTYNQQYQPVYDQQNQPTYNNQNQQNYPNYAVNQV